MMRRCIVRVQCYRPLIFALRPRPVPIVIEFHVSQRSVGFGQRAIYLDCFGRRVFRQRENILWRTNTLTAQKAVAVGESRVGERVVWIFGDGLTEIIDGLLIALCRAFVPVESTLQIELIRVGVGGVVFSGSLLFGAGQPLTQFL